MSNKIKLAVDESIRRYVARRLKKHVEIVSSTKRRVTLAVRVGTNKYRVVTYGGVQS